MAAAPTTTKATRYASRKAEGRQPASIEFDRPLYERIRSRATREQRPIASLVRIACEEYLERHGG